MNNCLQGFGNIVFMTAYFISLVSGLLISFTGTLPLGNLNVAAMHISARENAERAAWFSLGVSIIEMIYLSITLRAIGWVLQHAKLFMMLQWLAVAFLLLLAVASFINMAKKEGEMKNVIIDNEANRFILGMSMGLINPIQFPFWAGWSAYAITKGWVTATNTGYNLFTLGVGIGSMIALYLFIYLGKRLSGFMMQNQKMVQLGMGVLFSGMALYQVAKII